MRFSAYLFICEEKLLDFIYGQTIVHQRSIGKDIQLKVKINMM